ncbi:MAG: hypothetical protein IJI60_01125 [Bacilli bacterium]|nr:hypothetical protein [Bacilli bacterium]
MKEKIANLVNDSIQDLGVYVFDAYLDTEEGKTRMNIVLDSEEVIDLNRITDASRVINKILDQEEKLLENVDELDIFSREKGDCE